MKKIAILTWLNNKNYGSVLQAYALQKYIRNLGFEAIDIDYDASTSEKLKNWIKQGNPVSLYKDKIDNVLLKLKSKNKADFKKRNQLFDEFKKEHIKTTKKYKKPTDLLELAGKFDIYICGSDQIWSPKLMNPIFYFSFLPSESYKVAYAPSFGVDKIEERKKERIKKLIATFKHISIREAAGQNILYEFFKKKYPILVDPTFLISKNEWLQIAKNGEEKEEYILCYFLTPNNKYVKIIQKYAKAKKLKVIIITTPVGPFNTGFEEKAAVGPKEWLGYFCNAKYIFTDSYHGTIFSIIFNKQFTIFKRFADNNKLSQNSRIYSLLKICNLTSRLADEKAIINFDDKINYKNVNELINKKISESKEWLKKAL